MIGLSLLLPEMGYRPAISLIGVRCILAQKLEPVWSERILSHPAGIESQANNIGRMINDVPEPGRWYEGARELGNDLP